MLPQTIPTLEGRRVTLRPFRESDAPLVQSVADDPLIPLITTVPTSGSLEDALAYIDRQHERLTSGAGYSFAIANHETDEMIGQIGVAGRHQARPGQHRILGRTATPAPRLRQRRPAHVVRLGPQP